MLAKIESIYVVNTLAVGDLATQGAKASTAMVLLSFYKDIRGSELSLWPSVAI